MANTYNIVNTTNVDLMIVKGCDLKSFHIPLGVSLDVLKLAAARLTAAELRSCTQENVAALARLVSEIVRVIHELDPTSHNIRLNPNRSDEVMVYMRNKKGFAPVPSGAHDTWSLLTLMSALRMIFDQVVDELGYVMAPPGVISDAVEAAITKQKGAPLELPAAARKEFTVHLTNLQANPSAGRADKLSTNAAGLPLATKVATRGISMARLITAVAFEVEATESVAEGAERALYALARAVYWRTDAHTISAFSLAAPGLAALVTPHGWGVAAAPAVAVLLLAAHIDKLHQTLHDIRAVNAECGFGLPPATVAALEAADRYLLSRPAESFDYRIGSEILRTATDRMRANYGQVDAPQGTNALVVAHHHARVQISQEYRALLVLPPAAEGGEAAQWIEYETEQFEARRRERAGRLGA